MSKERNKVRDLSIAFLIVLTIGAGCATTGTREVVAPESDLIEAIMPAAQDREWAKNRWLPRHEAKLKRITEGDVALLMIGDSITHGWEGRPKNPKDPKGGKEVWDRYYGHRKAVNLGYGGDRTQNVLWRLQHGEVGGISPKLAVIMIGTNNSGNNTSAQIAEGVEVIVGQLKKKTPQTKVLILAVFPRGKDANDKRRKVNEGANQGMAKLADGKQVHYLDIGDKFLAKDKTLSREIMPDLLHLSPQGYEIWASSIESMVAKLLGE